MASLKKTQTTNKELFDTIRNLVKYSNETGVSIYRAVANKLSAPASQRAKLNMSRLDKLAKEGETIIVSGKILGDGSFSKKNVTVVAFAASEGAITKLTAAGSKFVTINQHLSTKPDNKLRILC